MATVTEVFLLTCELGQTEKVRIALPNPHLKPVLINPKLEFGSAIEITIKNKRYDILKLLLNPTSLSLLGTTLSG